MKFVWPLCFENHTFLPRGLNAGSVIVDLGLNRGRFAMAMIERFNCRVFGCEPVSTLFDALPQCDRFVAWQAAAGGTDGETTIRIYRDHCASAYSVQGADLQATERVAVLSLQSLLERIGASRIDLVKIDIEGAECPLLEEATDDTILSAEQYTVEFHDFQMPELSERVLAIKERMKSLGYHCITFSLTNGDVLFVKRSAISLISHIWLSGPVKYGMGIRRRLDRLL